MTLRQQLICIALLFLTTGQVRANDFISPYVDDQTYAVVRIDAGRLDLNAVTKSIKQHVELALGNESTQHERAQATTGINAAKGILMPWIQSFTSAGGKDFYLLVNTGAIWTGQNPAFLVAQLPNDEKRDGFMKLLASMKQMLNVGPVINAPHLPGGTTVVTKAPASSILIGPKSLVDQFPVKPTRTATLQKAFGAAGDSPIQLLMIPPDHVHRAIEEVAPTLPKTVGGGSTTAITRGFRFGVVELNIKPKLSATATIQSQDAASANELKQAITRALGMLDQVAKQEPDAADVIKTIQTLAPEVQDDRVILNINSDTTLGIARSLQSSMTAARSRAKKIAVLSQIRQIAVGCHVFANKEKNKGQFPPDLATLVIDGTIDASLVLSPNGDKVIPSGFTNWQKPNRAAWINKNADLVYIPGLNRDQGQRVLAFEKQPNGDSAAVLFADGHGEIQSLDEAEKLVKKETGFTLEQWSRVKAGEWPEK